MMRSLEEPKQVLSRRVLAIAGVVIWIASIQAVGQDAFRVMGDKLPDLHHARILWSDYDGDGRSDMVILGLGREGVPYSRVRRHLRDVDLLPGEQSPIEVHETVYSNGITLTPELGHGAVAWGDYDADGDLDLLVAGRDEEGLPATRLYRSEQSQMILAQVLDGLYAGAAAWGDGDNDGDLDLLVCGIDQSESFRTFLYENVRGSLRLRPSSFLNVAYCDAAWRDYDGDGDLDVLIAGHASSHTPSTRLYRNESGWLFAEVATTLEGLFFASVDWGDYDNDGDPDLVISGGRLSPFVFDGVVLIYRNENGHLIKTGAGIRGAYYGAAVWGDYDNDGDLDLLVSGGTHPFLALGTEPTGSRIGMLYENDSGTFRPARFPGGAFSFGGGLKGDATWGDYDGDNDLDFVVVGQRGAGAGFVDFVDVFRNEGDSVGIAPNTPPSPPTALGSDVTGDRVRLTWDAASDAQTPAPGLSYNVRVGTMPGGLDIVPPQSHPVTGRRLVHSAGNAGQGTSCLIHDLAPGTYHWSVQAIDHSFKASPFAQERTFVVGE